jgi:hypothetical protein
MENEIIHFNVGGSLYDVARNTLLKFENTMLANLVSDRWRNGHKDDIIFIDRDGDRFKYILDWYRDGKIHISKTVTYLISLTRMTYIYMCGCIYTYACIHVCDGLIL